MMGQTEGYRFHAQRTWMRAFAVVLGITCWLASAATTAAGEGRHGRMQADSRGSHHGGRHHHHGFGRGPFFPLFLGPSVVVASPVVIAAPAYAAPPPAYGPYAPYSYGGAVQYSAPPPPMPRVVEFPTGRYELRGDGVYTPYSWVWIPNPPVAPPASPAPPPPATGVEPVASRTNVAVALYRWTDEDGVTTWTDNPEKIPARFRGQARRLVP
jgi:Domain of unknown function (DUF4124)